MNLYLYSPTTFIQMDWPEALQGSADQRYLQAMMTHGPHHFIDNVAAEMWLLQVDANVIPLILGNTLPHNAYVCSNISHYIDYAIAELEIEMGQRKVFNTGATVALKGCGWWFQRSNIERVVFVNNWLLSTNLYPPLAGYHMIQIRDFLCRAFPDRAIVFKSINTRLNQPLYDSLIQAQFLPIVSRQVYIQDPAQRLFTRHDSWRRDQRLKKRSAYRWLDSSQIPVAGISRLKDLYDDLYIHKYSPLNPRFNTRFIAQAMAEKWLDIFALVIDEQIDAMVGYVVRDGVLTTPLVGYDRALPQSLGLYRLAVLKTLEDAAEQGHILHQSSGAAHFKRSRGSEAALEYNMVFVEHLSLRQQLPWRMLKQMSQRLLIPMLQHYQL